MSWAGLDYLDREKAKRRAIEQAHHLADERYGAGNNGVEYARNQGGYGGGYGGQGGYAPQGQYGSQGGYAPQGQYGGQGGYGEQRKRIAPYKSDLS